MNTNKNKKILSSLALLGVVSLILIFSIDFAESHSAGKANSVEEGFLLPDIHFIKYSLERLSEIFELF